MIQGDLQNRLVSMVKRVIEPDLIFLLGSIYNNRRTESIFNSTIKGSEYISEYFLLILKSNDSEYSVPQLQDRMEQYCQTIVATTCLVLETGTFTQWLKEGHFFARTVVMSKAPIYQAVNVTICAPGEYNEETVMTRRSAQYREGIIKSQEFLAGVELFRIRKHFKLAMFMLHQAAEQILSAMVKIGMGYYCCTHSIERLLRYASFVFGEITEIFPRNNESEKRLFSHLQKAYIDSRYSEDYAVNYKDLDAITRRVRLMYTLLEEGGKKWLI